MMLPLTIRTKLILAYTLLFGIILSLFAAVIYEAVQDERVSKLSGKLESHAEKIHSEIEEHLDRHIFPDVGDLAEIKTPGLEGVRFQLFDTSGSIVIADSVLSEAGALISANLLAGRTLQDQFRIHGDRYSVFWVPLEINETIRYVLQVAAPTIEIETDLARLRFLLIISVPLTLLIAGAAAALIARSAFRPITAMIKTANKITGTNLQERIAEPSANDEVQLLARTLNSMIERIDTAFESQRQFVADASHEIRTPLTIIRSELEFAQRTITDSSALESLRISLSEVDHLAHMADGLLMLARMDSSQFRLPMQALRLDELLVECVQKMKSSAERGRVSLDVRVETAIEIMGDAERLKSVVLNLLDNAIKFSPRGGSVLCALSVGNTETVTVSVRDQGPGMAESEIPHIFKRFYQSETTRSIVKGSGLGLAIVGRIVELHGGSVAVQSTPGSGSTFSVNLPCQIPSASS